MAAHVVVKDDGIRVTSFMGFSQLVAWSQIQRVGIYRGRSLWGTEELIKVYGTMMSRPLFFVPLNEHMTNFDSLKAAIEASPVPIQRRPGFIDVAFWGARTS